MPWTPSVLTLSAEGRITRCRVTGMAKNRTTAARAAATHIHPRCPGRFSEICTLRGPDIVDAGAGAEGAVDAIPNLEVTACSGSLLQASSSFSKSDAV